MAKVSDKDKLLENVELARKVFQKYVEEKSEENKIIYYIPSNNNDKDSNIAPIAARNLGEQNGLFPMFLFNSIKQHNSLLLPKLMGKVENEKIDIINQNYIKTICWKTLGSVFDNNLSLEHNALPTSVLLLNLFYQYDSLIDKNNISLKTSVDEKRVNLNDWKKHDALLVKDTHFINLKPLLLRYIQENDKLSMWVDFPNDNVNIIKKPNLEDVIDSIEHNYTTLFDQIIKLINSGEGLKKSIEELSKERQELINKNNNQDDYDRNSSTHIPTMKPQNSKTGKKSSRKR